MSWDKAITFALKWEGGYVSHKNDKGGPTNRGITQAVLTAAYASGLVKCQDVRYLTKAEAITIYKARYWDAYDWGGYPAPIDQIMFDITVNSGIGNAALIAQRACVSLGSKLEIDGKWGPLSRRALYEQAWTRGAALAKMLLVKRLNFYNAIVASRPDQRVFLPGWRNRTYALAKDCGIKL